MQHAAEEVSKPYTGEGGRNFAPCSFAEVAWERCLLPTSRISHAGHRQEPGLNGLLSFLIWIKYFVPTRDFGSFQFILLTS